MQLTPPNIPQAFLVDNVTQTWTAQSDNQLAIVVYSEE